ncbi:MAG: cobalamin biosynthesis protein [Nocardiopsaceae bacterium]|jgi:adenosylcobinamide-phosphate synthase|nr:cobalamin biosynthesis protein [Nocardiopsaceae bacterium]
MSRDWADAAGLAAGVIADALFGDPRRRHPVAGFGAVAQLLEQRIYSDSRARGAAFAACGLALAAGPAGLAARGCRDKPAARSCLTAAGTWTVVGGRSLARSAEKVRRALARSDIDLARTLLPDLCGRDPEPLDAVQITAAVIESVAENTSDAIVAPLLWGALGGCAGLAGYRAINTLDAMVGHRNPRYERFGWASARLDDVANVVPARLTALLTAACAPAVSGSAAAAWLVARRDGPMHPSPNAGWCEAAFAGALGVRLGGPVSYRGMAESRPVLGRSGRRPVPQDIRRAVRLSRAVTAAATGTAVALAAATGSPAHAHRSL